MPAEWAPHAATWLAWPHNAETWPGRLEKMPALWATMALHLARYETVNICVRDEKMEQEARKIIAEKSIPYQNVLSAKDILLVGTRARRAEEPEEEPSPASRRPAYNQPYMRRR